MRLATLAVLVASGLGLAGCGSAGSLAASRPDPPAPVALSAYVGANAVRISPARIGAGPMLLTVVNQRAGAVVLTVTRGSLTRARTAPLNPQGVTQLKVDLSPGSYAITATDVGRNDAQRARDSVQALSTSLTVEPERTSSGGQVLQP